MKIITHLDLMLVKRKVRSKELANAIDLTDQNISLLKVGKAKGIRFSTLAKICHYLRCQPGDLLEYVEGEEEEIFHGL